MKKVIQILLFFGLALSFTNCTITKRSYRSGYHVSWKSNHKSGQEKATVEDEDSSYQVAEIEAENIGNLQEAKITETQEKKSKTINKERKEAKKRNKTLKRDEKLEKTKQAIEVFQKRYPRKILEKPDEEEPEEPKEEREALNALVFFLSVIGFIVLAVPLFWFGFLIYLILTGGLFGGNDPKLIDYFFGGAMAFIIYWLGTWLLLLLFFQKRDATDEEKNKRIFIKAIIALILAVITTFALVVNSV